MLGGVAPGAGEMERAAMPGLAAQILAKAKRLSQPRTSKNRAKNKKAIFENFKL